MRCPFGPGLTGRSSKMSPTTQAFFQFHHDAQSLSVIRRIGTKGIEKPAEKQTETVKEPKPATQRPSAAQMMQNKGKTAVHVHLGAPKEQWFESYAFYQKHGYLAYKPRFMKKELR